MKTATINLRVLGACSAFASKDETRYYLNGVCIEIEPRRTTYIATDGHRAIVYRDDLMPDDADNVLTGTFIIPVAHCKPFKIAKEDTAVAKIIGEEGTRLTIAHTFVDVTFNPIDGTFPDWRHITPTGTPSGAVAQFNMEYLAAFRKFAKAMGLGEYPSIAHNGPNPAIIWFGSEDNVLGIIMPTRADSYPERQAPRWAVSGTKATEDAKAA